jgi:clan AA aspartic protease
MEGYVDEFGQPKIEATFIGPAGKIITEAIIDTGFSGDVCLPIPIAIQLGLQLRGSQEILLADGTRKSTLLFAGQVILDREPEEVRIFLTELSDVLIGTQLLRSRTLEVNFKTGHVSIWADNRPGGESKEIPK